MTIISLINFCRVYCYITIAVLRIFTAFFERLGFSCFVISQNIKITGTLIQQWWTTLFLHYTNKKSSHKIQTNLMMRQDNIERQMSNLLDTNVGNFIHN